jgi:transcriptional regulator with AAA-type ATPase domain
MDEPNRSVAKRQIARLIGSSSTPTYVLSEDDTIVFANDALETLFGRDPDSLLGLQCVSPSPDDEVADALLVSLLALPINWSRRSIKQLPFDLSIAGVQPADPDPHSLLSQWNRCLIPLESSGGGCTLCILSETRGILSETSDPDAPLDYDTAIIHRVLQQSRARYPFLNGLWFLQGSSPRVHRALAQSQIAISCDSPVTIFGPKGTGRSWLAHAIHAHHRSPPIDRTKSPGDGFDSSLIRVDCSLMDNELLGSLLELVDESSSNSAAVRSMLLDELENLSDDCLPLLANYLKTQVHVRLIATCLSPDALPDRKHHAIWNEILLRTGTLRIELPQLTQRLEDIPVLITAWLNAQPISRERVQEFTNEFVDALCAYPWPEDIEEFSTVMQYATHQAGDAKALTPNHLPVNVRTCVSHYEHSAKDESVDLDAILEDVERTMILRATSRFPKNKTAAAKLLNISRARLLRRLQQWGIQTDTDAANSDDDDQPIFNEVP